MRPDARLHLLLLVLVAFLVTGCGDDRSVCLSAPLPAASGTWVSAVLREGGETVIHTVDERRIVVPSDPQRIVSTLPGITEAVLMLDGGGRLVGVSPHDDDVPELAGIERVSVMPIAWEALQALEPDLLLVDETLVGAEIERLRQRFPAVLPLRSRSLADLKTSVELLAQVIGTPRALRKARRFGARLEKAVGEAVAAPGATPMRVLLLAQPDPVYALGPGSLMDDMLRTCGVVNIACDLGRASGPFASELVKTRRPDWILVTGGRVEDVPIAQWSDVPAVLQGRVLRADSDDLVRAGPRIPAALERLADVLHGRVSMDTLTEAR